MDLQERSLELIREASQVGATLRLFGGLAVQMLVPHPTLVRASPGDIDFVGLSSELPVLLALFARRGYIEDLDVRRLFGITRRIFDEPRQHIKLDLCLDVLLFARPIDCRQRLDVRPFTISVADLLLSKLQPREITKKDLVDIVNILMTFVPGQKETASEFHLGWFVDMCSKDWGLFQLVVENLVLARELTQDFPLLEDRVKVDSRISLILDRLQGHPKSLRWRLRDIIGKRVPYWNEVTVEAGS